MIKPFPRKEIYVYTTDKPLDEKSVFAIKNKDLTIPDYLKDYSEKKWSSDNKGWTSSVIPSAVEVEFKINSYSEKWSREDIDMKIHCGLTEYKYLLGMVKLADEKKISDNNGIIHGLSIEIIPIFADGTLILEQRLSSSTQHGVGFYDFPTASQNAEIYIKKAEDKYPGLVKSMFDVSGFSRFHILKAFEQIKPEQISNIYYTGFSRGFEVSLDSQFNGYTTLPVESKEVMKKSESSRSENRLVYKREDLMDVLDSIGSHVPQEDIYNKRPGTVYQTGEFTIIDDCLGNILSMIYHLDREKYGDALSILKERGYKINEVKPKGNLVKLDELV